MRLVRDLSYTGLAPSSVVTVGNFDGMHRGHQALIRRCRECASGRDTVAVVTFEPLPQTVLNPEEAPARLTGVGDKLRLLQSAGVDLVWMMRFNQRLAATPAERFVRDVLGAGLRARRVVLGQDFRFGHRREGDLARMQELGAELGFATETVDPVMHSGKRISSTVIRQALAEGRLDDAAAMLGRRFSVSGRVVPGQRLGRRLGYPTANMRPVTGPAPLSGIFAVRVRVDDRWWGGVASFGRRPAVGGGDARLEVHLFGFDGDLYGRRVETQFVHKIRDEEHFASLDEMVARMREDEQQARAILAADREHVETLEALNGLQEHH